jgi:PadR family transcriptional regulator PadR
MMGEFEYLLLTAVMRLGEDAYGAAIRREIEEATGRRCSIGALYTTMDRLQIKGLIETWMGDSTPQRGGRAKRMVRVTPKGIHRPVELAPHIGNFELLAGPSEGELAANCFSGTVGSICSGPLHLIDHQRIRWRFQTFQF